MTTMANGSKDAFRNRRTLHAARLNGAEYIGAVAEKKLGDNSPSGTGFSVLLTFVIYSFTGSVVSFRQYFLTAGDFVRDEKE